MSGMAGLIGEKSGLVTGEGDPTGRNGHSIKAFAYMNDDSGGMGYSMNISSITISIADMTVFFVTPVYSPMGGYDVYKWSTGNQHHSLQCEDHDTNYQGSIGFFTRQHAEGSTSVQGGNFNGAHVRVFGGGA